VKRVWPEPIWLRRPDFADVLIRREAPEGLEPLGEVGHEEGVDVRFESSVRALMVTLNRRLLEGSVHPLNLTISPGMVWLGQPVRDTVGLTRTSNIWTYQLGYTGGHRGEALTNSRRVDTRTYMSYIGDDHEDS
jgi:hypothetical protein